MEGSPHIRPYIGVVGAGVPDADTDRLAEAVGRAVGESGAVLVCGGMTGVMEAACRGAKAAGGTTLGILPSSDRRDANPYVDIAVTTGLGEIRNALVVRASDAVVAVRGESGTLSEIAFALKTGTPVVGIDTWDLPGVTPFDDPVEASDESEVLDCALELAYASHTLRWVYACDSEESVGILVHDFGYKFIGQLPI